MSVLRRQCGRKYLSLAKAAHLGLLLNYEITRHNQLIKRGISTINCVSSLYCTALIRAKEWLLSA
jgi:hypothetical protein